MLVRPWELYSLTCGHKWLHHKQSTNLIGPTNIPALSQLVLHKVSRPSASHEGLVSETKPVHLSQLRLETVTALTRTAVYRIGLPWQPYSPGCMDIPWLPRMYGYCTLWQHLWSFMHHGTNIHKKSFHNYMYIYMVTDMHVIPHT